MPPCRCPRAMSTSGFSLPWVVSGSLVLLAACNSTQVGGADAPPPELQNFTQQIPGTKAAFDMVAIPGGEFVMGSPADERDREDAEGPQRQVTLQSFWIGKFEVSWDEYDLWSSSDGEVDGVTRPTQPYVDMTFGMGREGYPAVCMTRLAAKTYCEWLSKVTGHKYRLPTEAEWEYACRAGTRTAFSFGEDSSRLSDYAWFMENAEEEYHLPGTKMPNAWGIFDMHGNVAEWTLDQLLPYDSSATDNPHVEPTELYPVSVRGGSFLDAAPLLRSARRLASHPDWKIQDPQIPKSIWYHTDADFVGFRVVREWTGENRP